MFIDNLNTDDLSDDAIFPNDSSHMNQLEQLNYDAEDQSSNNVTSRQYFIDRSPSRDVRRASCEFVEIDDKKIPLVLINSGVAKICL